MFHWSRNEKEAGTSSRQNRLCKSQGSSLEPENAAILWLHHALHHAILVAGLCTDPKVSAVPWATEQHLPPGVSTLARTHMYTTSTLTLTFFVFVWLCTCVPVSLAGPLLRRNSHVWRCLENRRSRVVTSRHHSCSVPFSLSSPLNNSEATRNPKPWCCTTHTLTEYIRRMTGDDLTMVLNLMVFHFYHL